MSTSSFSTIQPNHAAPGSLGSAPRGRVIVGMSGGVDSSVAAYLLQQQGYRVEGLFMKNWDEDDGTDYCTAIADLEDAQQVADRLGITLHTANFAAEYWDNVFEHFLAEYRSSRTPNPDILCNREIKFEQFVNYADTLGADFIATGHYVARVDPIETERSAKDGQPSFELHKGADANKDQSYFLQAVPRERLAKCLFPLGPWTKDEIRALAESLGLPNHRKKDSTGICFIGERRFADFLARYIEDRAGPVCDLQGRTLGQHKGLHYYTLGQRQGIALGGLAGRPERPWYVAGKSLSDNILYVTQHDQDLEGHWLRAGQVNWLADIELPITCTARIRYRQNDQACRVSQAANGHLLVSFAMPQRAITPGQYIAFYAGEQMLGGACIEAADQQTRTTLGR